MRVVMPEEGSKLTRANRIRCTRLQASCQLGPRRREDRVIRTLTLLASLITPPSEGQYKGSVTLLRRIYAQPSRIDQTGPVWRKRRAAISQAYERWRLCLGSRR